MVGLNFPKSHMTLTNSDLLKILSFDSIKVKQRMRMNVVLENVSEKVAAC